MNKDIRHKLLEKIKKLEKVIKKLETSQTLGIQKQEGKRKIRKLESLHGDRFVRESNFQSRTIDYVPTNLRPLV